MWTTTRTPEVAQWLEDKAYDEVRRYVISELDVANAADLGAPGFEIVTFADRPDLEEELHALARLAYADQPGRSETRIDELARLGPARAPSRRRTSSRSRTGA